MRCWLVDGVVPHARGGVVRRFAASTHDAERVATAIRALPGASNVHWRVVDVPNSRLALIEWLNGLVDPDAWGSPPR